MNKKISLIAISLVLCFVALFAVGCNNTINTSPSVRWADNESLTYTVSMNVLPDEVGYKDKIVIDETNKVSKIFLANEFLLPGTASGTDEDGVKKDYTFNMNEVYPSDAVGTFTTDIVLSDNYDSEHYTGKYFTYTTTQEVTYTYNSKFPDDKTNPEFAIVSEFVSTLTAEQKTAIVVGEPTADQIVLKSTMDTVTEFKNENIQRPLYSKRTLTGFYVGGTIIGEQITNHSAFSSYDITCVYENNKVTVNNGVGEPVSKNIPDSTIDLNQIYLYQRGLDESKAFTSHSVNVFNPIDNKVASATFGLTQKYGTRLFNIDDENISNATVNLMRINFTVDGITRTTHDFYNNRNSKFLDITSSDNRNSYIPVKWHNGYLVYELENDQYSETARQELNPKSADNI